jgi:xanthine dehydrogenase large subunit
VNDRAIFHLDNCYYLDALAVRSLRLRTHTVSNTAFRGFGGPQGIFAIEYILDDIARFLGLDPLAVREANFYGEPGSETRTTTHYGMPVQDNVAPALVAQLARDCDYRRPPRRHRRVQCTKPGPQARPRPHPGEIRDLLHRHHYNQAGAQVCIYADGSALVTHGGTEMGQGSTPKSRRSSPRSSACRWIACACRPPIPAGCPIPRPRPPPAAPTSTARPHQAAARKIRKRLAEFFCCATA